MRKVLFAIVTLVAFVSALPGGDEAPVWSEKLFDNKIEHDFGSVAHGTQMLHKFAFKNIYAVPLDVTISKVSCGCTTAAASTRKVEPHGTGTIDVNMNGRIFTGSRTVYVHVTFSHPQFYSTAILKVMANSRPDIVFNPGEINFGVVTQGQSAAQDITVEYAGTFRAKDGSPWTVDGVVTNGLPVEAKFAQLREPAGQVGYKVSVSLKPDAPAGSLKGEMFLKTNDPVSPLLPVLVEGNVQAALTVAPPVVRVSGPANETRSASVAVRGNRAFRILSVEGMGEGITLANPLPDEPAETHRLTFRIKVSDFHRKVQITTDLQKTPVTVTIDGSVSE